MPDGRIWGLLSLLALASALFAGPIPRSAQLGAKYVNATPSSTGSGPSVAPEGGNPPLATGAPLTAQDLGLVPESTTLGLTGAALLALGLIRRQQSH